MGNVGGRETLEGETAGIFHLEVLEAILESVDNRSAHFLDGVIGAESDDGGAARGGEFAGAEAEGEKAVEGSL